MASAPEKSFKQKILEENLCCGICEETLRHPKALPCLHSFCKECLTKWMSTRGGLSCPICRLDVPLPTDGVAGLPDNHLIAELCEKFSKKPADQEQDATQNCEYHPSKELQFICKSSKCGGLPICMQCFEESHVGHNHYVVQVKTEANEQMKKLITPLLEEKKKQVEDQNKYLKEIQDLENLITDGKNESEKNIKDSYAERVRLLTEDKDRLLKDMQQSYADNMRDFNAKKDAVQQQVKDLTDIMEEVEQTKTDPIKFLDEKDNLRDKLKQTKVDPLPAPLEVTATLCRPHEIKKKHLANGELVTEVFTIRETTRWWSATELRSSIRQKAQTARETFHTFRH
ncbi:PREDICTED: tripartite motif-containing protein 2-like [Branchiostoma belcheri]|uniref:Tripartite motif-containing protein 2-like n=1 Tax=Branchiostoma belcheri TaxID=7741 RepID=A0A6P5AFR7_BRABE|nr:PREDICTED: tripartite motif-containing protein 2-like [Branchiostoma belcheri]